MLPFPFDVIFIVGWLMIGIGLTLTAVERIRRKPQRLANPIPGMRAKHFTPRFTVQNNVKISAALLEQRLKEAKNRDG